MVENGRNDPGHFPLLALGCRAQGPWSITDSTALFQIISWLLRTNCLALQVTSYNLPATSSYYELLSIYPARNRVVFVEACKIQEHLQKRPGCQLTITKPLFSLPLHRPYTCCESAPSIYSEYPNTRGSISRQVPVRAPYF